MLKQFVKIKNYKQSSNFSKKKFYTKKLIKKNNFYKNYFLINFLNLNELTELKSVIKFNFFYLKKLNLITDLSSVSSFKFKNQLKNLFLLYIKKKKLKFIKYKFKFYKHIQNVNFFKINNINSLPDNLLFSDLLKTHKLTTLNLKNLINVFGYIHLKFSGINTFITLTNNEGNVYLHIPGEFLKILKELKKKNH